MNNQSLKYTCELGAESVGGQVSVEGCMLTTPSCDQRLSFFLPLTNMPKAKWPGLHTVSLHLLTYHISDADVLVGDIKAMSCLLHKGWTLIGFLLVRSSERSTQGRRLPRLEL